MRLYRWLVSGCVVGLTASLAACGSSGSSSGGGAGSTSSPSLVVETAFVLKTLDPARMFEPTGLMIDHAIYDTLLTYKGSNVSTPVPDIATSYTASSDAKTYTFTLRKGVKFANGDPVTAADVVFSLMRTKNVTGNPHGLGLAVLAPFLIIGAPLVEELFFRGLVLRSLSRRGGAVLAVVGSSVLFGLVHFQTGMGAASDAGSPTGRLYPHSLFAHAIIGLTRVPPITRNGAAQSGHGLLKRPWTAIPG